MKPAIIKRNNKIGYVYRIIIRYYDEYDNLVSKETSYKPEPGMTEAKAEVYAELYVTLPGAIEPEVALLPL